jgi:hypothetical protein
MRERKGNRRKRKVERRNLLYSAIKANGLVDAATVKTESPTQREQNSAWPPVFLLLYYKLELKTK